MNLIMHQSHKINLALMIVLFGCSFSLASKSFASQLEQQREYYQQIKKQKFNLNSKSYQTALTKLQGYPLMPYFEQNQLRRNLALKNEQQISDFLEQYQGEPVAIGLRKDWLNHLYISNKPSRYQQYFRNNIDDRLTCIELDYQRQKNGSSESLLDEIGTLWLNAKSRPDECDTLFKVWQQAGRQTDSILWQRILLAQNAKQYILTKYLLKQLSPEQDYLVKLFKQYKRFPNKLTTLNYFTKQTPQEAAVITYVLKRLIWKDEQQALKVFLQSQQQQRFNDNQYSSLMSRLTVAAARSDKPDVKLWYQSLDSSLISDRANQWQMANGLSKSDYRALLSQIETLEPNTLSTRQWRYWQARAWANTNNIEQANAQLQQLSKERSYYGFLAAARMGNSKLLNHKSLEASDQQLQAISEHASGQRAFELFAIGQLSIARREWRHWQQQLSHNEQLASAYLAFQKGWYDRSIESLGRLGELNDTDIRFPQPYAKSFAKFAKKYQINEAWAYAIARKESIFMTDAKSSVGALGLMQLRPSTANDLSAKKVNSWSLLQADTNVKFGISYLSRLLSQFDNNIVLATAAYNAGPGNVRRWLKKQSNLPADVWIETIPFKETREYVKSVLAYTEIYQQKYSKDKPSPFTDLANMQINFTP